MVAAERTENVSQILEALGRGESDAEQRLFTAVYNELRRMAHGRMARERPGQTLQTTALVHEAYLRLVGDSRPQWENRRHFFGAAANAMRQILVEKARKRRAVRHGGSVRRVALEDDVAEEMDPEEFLFLDEALTRLAQRLPRKAKVVAFRYFLGLTVGETAELLGISRRTVDADWELARAWLKREMVKGVSDRQAAPDNED